MCECSSFRRLTVVAATTIHHLVLIYLLLYNPLIIQFLDLCTVHLAPSHLNISTSSGKKDFPIHINMTL